MQGLLWRGKSLIECIEHISKLGPIILITSLDVKTWEKGPKVKWK